MDKQRMEEKMKSGFSKWWFLNGGSIHALWKSRKYSELKHLALIHPKLAYNEGYSAGYADRDARCCCDELTLLVLRQGERIEQAEQRVKGLEKNLAVADMLLGQFEVICANGFEDESEVTDLWCKVSDFRKSLKAVPNE